MQVSWIDAERLKALVAQIAPLETSVEESSAMVEIDTTPGSAPDNADEAWGFAMQWAESASVTNPGPEIAPARTASDEPPPQTNTEREATDEGPGPSIPPHPAAALPLSRIRDKLRAIRQRATDAGILTRMREAAPKEAAAQEVPVSAPWADAGRETAGAGVCEETSMLRREPEPAEVLPQTPAFEVPQGSREVRLTAFAGWARQVIKEDDAQMLVMSDDGEVLWGGETKAGLVLSTMMAWGAAIRTSALSACETPLVIHQPLASGNVLTVIPCETAAGMVHAAVAAPAGLSHAQAHTIRRALCAAIS